MSRSFTLLMLFLALSIGFAFGRFTAPEGPPRRSVESNATTAAKNPERAVRKRRSSKRPPRRLRRTTAVDTKRERTPGPDAVQSGRAPEPGEEGVDTAEPIFADADAALAPEDMLAAIEDALEQGDAPKLERVALTLQSHGDFLVPELVAILERTDSLFAKEHLAKLLGATQSREALPALQGMLEDDTNDGVRTAAIAALGEIPDASSVPILAAEFTRETDSPMPPSLAASSLGKIGTPASITALQKEIRGGSNGMVRAFSLKALSELKDPALVPFFLEEARRTEARHQVDGQETITAISDRYRRQAIEAIAETGDASAIPLLEEIALSPDSNQGLQESAKRAINALAGETIYDIR